MPSLPELVPSLRRQFPALAREHDGKPVVYFDVHAPQRVAQELLLRLGLTVEVECVELGSLPRFEGKGKRFVDQRRRG
jgi:phenylacetate-coenzyme A ligase PaaK-like adenylate-forming protein